MQRNNFPLRPTAFRIPISKDRDANGNSYPAPSVFVHRKTFVMRQTGRLRGTDGSIKTVRRILIFDDHPDSLRLILGDSASRDGRRTSRGWATLRIFILPGIAALTALIAMFWPLL